MDGTRYLALTVRSLLDAISHLARLGVAIPVIERLLNHVSGTFAGIVGVYHHYDYAKEMREAIELWEKHIQTLTA